ncbi:MAG TPA: HEAT repeat domain-containing protein [Myxococcota bacterium]|nr:HEAT repeat domain-containing protein [Myxococcota bacterium]HQP94744.1 HEAT repeat domain-containing protein [Myxococcota bacterium]
MTRTNRPGRFLSIIVALILTVGVPMAALARPFSEVKYNDVMRVLESSGDPTPEQFRSCGSGIPSILADILSGRRIEPEIRVRAARALSRYPGERSRMVLTSTATTPDEDVKVRASCLVGLGRLMGGVSIPDIKPFLADASPVIREGAATALATIGGPRARQMLLDAISIEPDLEVRMSMDSALNRMSDEESGGVGSKD